MTEDASQCGPDGYAIIECNVCRCTLKGEIDHSQCTRNVCEEEAKNITNNNSFRRTDGVLGTCVANQWYSMAPCQYCYCANKNKLLCNTGGVSNSALKLGTYELSVCETNLHDDVTALFEKPLREGEVNVLKETKSEVSLTKTDDVSEEELVEANEKTVKKEKNNEDKKESQVVEVKTTVGKNTKAKVTRKVKKILREETLGKTVKPKVTPTVQITRMKDASYEIEMENSASNDQIDVGLNLDLGQPAAEVDQIPDETQEKLELDETGNDEKEKSEALRDVQNYLDRPSTFTDILDKFIHLAVRKSMMTLKPGESCLPGSQTSQGCNLCFCLKNGKMLCTNKVC